MKRFIFAIGLFVGCAQGDSDVLSYEEFKAQAYLEPDTGMYIINGDELVADDAAMRDIYNRYVETVYATMDDGYSSNEQTLIVNRVGGQDDRWAQATASNLTYCVDQKSFGSRYSTVVSALNSATGAWEATANVNFVHLSAEDGKCRLPDPALNRLPDPEFICVLGRRNFAPGRAGVDVP